MVYPDLWIGPLIGMHIDTFVTSTQHLDAMEAHFVAKIIKETHVQAHNVPIHIVFDFTDITNERIQVMSSLLIELTLHRVPTNDLRTLKNESTTSKPALTCPTK
jgi:hypothetical protein